jgi:hypothetical protein
MRRKVPMTSYFSKWVQKRVDIEPFEPGVYHYLAPDDDPIPYRLHLRIEGEDHSMLIVNAATILHLNQTATAYALQLVQGSSADDAAVAISRRFRVSKRQARDDYDDFRQKILTLATNPDVDPVLFLDLDRATPFADTPSAPYRLDIALTYTTNPDGEQDPLARARVDRECSTSEWKSVLDKAWGAGIPHVTFTGGEPTRRDDLVELVEYAETLGQVTGVLTDGRRLSDKSLVDGLSQAGLDHFLIVLVPDDQDCLDGIKNALASDVFTAIHISYKSDFEAEVENWLRRFSDMGVQAISLSGADDPSDLTGRLADLREHIADLGMDLIWDLPVPYSHVNPISQEITDAPQGAGRAWLYVEPDGDVLPAQGIDKIIGNFLRDPWEEIWKSAQEP